MWRWTSILIVIIALGACSPQRQKFDPSATAIGFGEAKYLISQCPNLKINQEALMGGLVVECLIRKATQQGCESKMTNDFRISFALGALRASKEYGNLPAPRQCQIATSKFGRNGTSIKGLVISK